MTDEEWNGKSSSEMLSEVQPHASSRKLRLFACACCFVFTKGLETDRGNELVRIAESYADDEIQLSQLDDARLRWKAKSSSTVDFDDQLYHMVSMLLGQSAHKAFWAIPANALLGAKSHLLRDIFGNPFNPVTVDPRWLTSNVVDLANAIYSERAFDRMPILSDALMDAGCDDDVIIAHCRSEGPHVRGCWVVDLLTGRK